MRAAWPAERSHCNSIAKACRSYTVWSNEDSETGLENIFKEFILENCLDSYVLNNEIAWIKLQFRW